MSGEYSLRNNLQTDWIKHDSTWKKGVDQNWKNIDWSLYKIVDQVVANIAALPSSPTNYQAFIVESENEVWVWNTEINEFNRFDLSSPFIFYDLNLDGWYQWISSVISIFTGSGGLGDVVGPSSSIDNHVCVFDGLTGKVIKMSDVIIDPSGNMSAVNNLIVNADATIGGDGTVVGIFDAQLPTTATVNAFWDKVQRPNSGTTATARELGQSSQVTDSDSSGNPTTISGMSVVLTTTGKPVFVGLMGNTASTPGSLINMNDSTLGSQSSNWYIRRGATTIYRTQWQAYFAGGSLPAGVIWTIDTPAAGTYTYTMQFESSGNTVNVTNVRLVAFEIG